MKSEVVELVEFIVSKFIDKDKFTVTEKKDQLGAVITVTADSKDLGKIIGKQGRIAKALRTIVKAASYGDKYFVEIKEN
jgi:predicted RNA-binding protein YlqC (UPF0109 family)